MATDVVITILSSAAGLLVGFVSTVSLMAYKTGRIVKEQEQMKEAVMEMNTGIASYRMRHESDHKTVDDNIHGNRREIGEVKTLAVSLDEWMKRLDTKMDGIFEAISTRGV